VQVTSRLSSFWSDKLIWSEGCSVSSIFSGSFILQEAKSGPRSHSEEALKIKLKLSFLAFSEKKVSYLLSLFTSSANGQIFVSFSFMMISLQLLLRTPPPEISSIFSLSRFTFSTMLLLLLLLLLLFLLSSRFLLFGPSSSFWLSSSWPVEQFSSLQKEKN